MIFSFSSTFFNAFGSASLLTPSRTNLLRRGELPSEPGECGRDQRNFCWRSTSWSHCRSSGQRAVFGSRL